MGRTWIKYQKIINFYKSIVNDGALSFLQQALKITKKTGDLRGEAVTLSNIGDLYRDMSRYKDSGRFYKQALEIYYKINDIKSIKRIQKTLTENSIKGV